MKLGYTILYVENVSATVEFYQKAFGLNLLFIHESLTYAEMDTGTTKLAFASFELAKMHGFELSHLTDKKISHPFELAFVTDDVVAAYETALKNGASALKVPEEKPWGQIVGYVKDCNDYLVELCSPIH